MALSLSVFFLPFAHVGATDLKSKTHPDHTIAYCYEALIANLEDISRYCGGAMLNLRISGEIKDSIPWSNRSELLSVLKKNLSRYEIKELKDAATIDPHEMNRIVRDAEAGKIILENVTYCLADIKYSLNKSSPHCGYVSAIINLSKYNNQIDYTKSLSRADLFNFSKEVLSSR
ncbi:hypothetical protein [Shinella sp.]|uniref:hypothetical protein n=1 Tax=Shinella sp. TaxID=1870904 RepID=UPI00403662AF